MNNLNDTPNFESFDHSTSSRSVKEVAKDIGSGISDVLRSEIRLATAELKHAVTDVKRNTISIAVGGSIALLGVLPMLAFLVIGLGRILDGNYWLSSLIVGLLFIGIGGLLAYSAAKRLKLEDLSLPRTRESVSRDSELISRKFRDISTSTQTQVSSAVSDELGRLPLRRVQ